MVMVNLTLDPSRKEGVVSSESRIRGPQGGSVRPARGQRRTHKPPSCYPRQIHHSPVSNIPSVSTAAGASLTLLFVYPRRSPGSTRPSPSPPLPPSLPVLVLSRPVSPLFASLRPGWPSLLTRQVSLHRSSPLCASRAVLTVAVSSVRSVWLPRLLPLRRSRHPLTTLDSTLRRHRVILGRWRAPHSGSDYAPSTTGRVLDGHQGQPRRPRARSCLRPRQDRLPMDNDGGASSIQEASNPQGPPRGEHIFLVKALAHSVQARGWVPISSASFRLELTNVPSTASAFLPCPDH